MREFILGILREMVSNDGDERFIQSPSGVVWVKRDLVRERISREFPSFIVGVELRGDALMTNPSVVVSLYQDKYKAEYEYYWMEWTRSVSKMLIQKRTEVDELLNEFRYGLIKGHADSRKVSIAATHFDNAFAVLRDSIPRNLQ